MTAVRISDPLKLDVQVQTGRFQVAKKAVVNFGVIALVLITMSVVVIQREGRKAREAINVASEQVTEAVRDGIADGVERSIEKAAEVPGKIMRDAGDVLLSDSTGTAPGKGAEPPESPPSNEVSRPTKGNDHKTAESKPDFADTDNQPTGVTTSEPTKMPPPLATSAPPRSTPESSRPADLPKAAPKTKVELNPDQLLRDTVKLGQELVKAADDVGQEMIGLSLAEEVQLGKEVNRQVCRQHKVASSSAATKRLRDLAQPLLKQVEREGITYTFTVLASPEINAFSHVGGYVYINQGILKFTSSDAELQFVLAHEIAHVDLGHCRRGLTYTVRAGDLAGGNGAAMVRQAYHLISLGYSEDQEFEADEWAFRRMITIDRTKEEALALTRHFARHFTDKAEKRSSVKVAPAAAVIADEIEKHLRSHPPASERVLRLEKLAAMPQEQIEEVDR